MEFRFSPHAVEEIQERDIPLQIVLFVLNDPGQILAEKKGRSAYQSKVEINGEFYVVRAVVEPDGTVVTVYKTSKLSRYWSE